MFEWRGEEGELKCFYATAGHIGGRGNNPDKQNQDAIFCTQCDSQTMVWGVLDGHGHDNGQLASYVGARELMAYYEAHHVELTRDPQTAMKKAFEKAHIGIRAALVEKYKKLKQPLTETAEGFLIEQDGQPVDGGSTATVVALLQGHLLVVANVGDSDALLGGKLADGSIGFEQLCADHSPTNIEEYIRMAQLADSKPRGWAPAICAYDTDAGSLLEIFHVSEGGEVDVDKNMLAQLDELDVGFKTARGDRPTACFVLETEEYGQQKLAVTRSLGDFYMQYHGATWEPTVSCIDLLDVASQLNQICLVLGSDGLWDLWPYKEVLEYPMEAGPADREERVVAPLTKLVENTRAQSEELFSEDADNISAVMVRFGKLVAA